MHIAKKGVTLHIPHQNPEMTTTHRYALIGRQLSHSFSQTYFSEKFASERLNDYSYDLLETEDLSDLRKVVEEQKLDGFNVTIPYKVEILPLLDEIDAIAQKIGAVNTVKVSNHCGHIYLKGYNTDAPAFAETLRPLLKPHHRSALILGTGGAAQAVAFGLEQLGIDHLFVSRNPHSIKHIDYSTAYTEAAEHTIIINATPVGMFPNCSTSPWERPDLMTPQHICYDLVYNPSPTRFMQEAAQRGATVQDGLPMLHRQADLAFSLWTSSKDL